MRHPLKISSEAMRARAYAYVDRLPLGGMIYFEPEPKRNLEQNARLWAMLGDISKQVEHAGMKHTPETWKALFMHSLGYETRFLSGLDGEPFPAGFRSSQLSVKEMAELITFIDAWGAENGVLWSERGFE